MKILHDEQSSGCNIFYGHYVRGYESATFREKVPQIRDEKFCIFECNDYLSTK